MPINKIFFLFFFFVCTKVYAKEDIISTQNIPTDFKIYTDLPYGANNNIIQDIEYSSVKEFKGLLTVACYKYTAGDSVLLFRKNNWEINFQSGTHKVQAFLGNNSETYRLQKFCDILNKVEQLPAGTYKFFIRVVCNTDSAMYAYAHNVDSVLSVTSPVRKDIEKQFNAKKTFLGIQVSPKIYTSDKADRVISYASRRINNKLRKRGLTSVTSDVGEEKIMSLYYQDWFIGKYNVQKNESISKLLNKEKDKLDNPASLVTNNFNDVSTFSQIKNIKKEKRTTTGEISLLTNISNGQEPSSDIDNNYYDLRGNIETTIYGVPVEINGYYTSQDMHRMAKASYINIHYDADAAKQQLMQSINAYKTKYGEVQNESWGMLSSYQTYINYLQGQKGQLLNEIKNSAGFEGIGLDSSAIREKLVEHIKNNSIANKEGKVADSIEEKYARLNEKYKKLEALQQKIDKYQALISQYKNTRYFDSAYAYSKLNNIGDAESYKQMAKKADALLPAGKAKSFISGLTNFDIGAINKIGSKYTMAGQNIKGLDIGYDLGFCQAGATAGITQYIGADGNVDKYWCYSGNVTFAPLKNEKIGLTYYGYMVNRNMLSSNDFFNNIDISEPGFKQPVHIIALSYNGIISKYVTVTSEIASSYKTPNKDSKQRINTEDRTAYNIDVTGNIPQTTISVEGSYENTGKSFENNTLPISAAGTRQVRFAGNGDFFSSFLSLGIEYNYLMQSNLSSTGGNTRWGFSVATHSRRYPSLSISYRPYTTFRSFSDTLAIAQKPLLGSVTTGKVNYQIRKNNRSLLLTLIYNNSSSETGFSTYKSTTFQWVSIYNVEKWLVSLGVGYIALAANDSTLKLNTPNNTRFLNLAFNYSINDNLSINGTQEFGVANFGFCKYATSYGFTYKFNKLPIILRSNFRYYTYQLTQDVNWLNLYSGSLEIIWQIKPSNLSH